MRFSPHIIHRIDKIIILSNKNSYNTTERVMKIIDTHFHPDTLIEFEKNKNNTLYSNQIIIENSKKKW